MFFLYSIIVFIDTSFLFSYIVLALIMVTFYLFVSYFSEIMGTK